MGSVRRRSGHWDLGILINVLLTIATTQGKPFGPFDYGNEVVDCSAGVVSFVPSNRDCHSFYQCSGYALLPPVRVSCGFLLFNHLTLTCDWPGEVVRLRPECSKTYAVFGQNTGRTRWGESGNGVAGVDQKRRQKQDKMPKVAVIKDESDESDSDNRVVFESNYPQQGRGHDEDEDVAETEAENPPFDEGGDGGRDDDEEGDRKVYFPVAEGREEVGGGAEQDEDQGEKLPSLFDLLPDAVRPAHEEEERDFGEGGGTAATRPESDVGEDEDEKQRGAPPPPGAETEGRQEGYFPQDGRDYYDVGQYPEYGEYDEYVPALPVVAPKASEEEEEKAMSEEEVSTTLRLNENSLLGVILGLDGDTNSVIMMKEGRKEEEGNQREANSIDLAVRVEEVHSTTTTTTTTTTTVKTTTSAATTTASTANPEYSIVYDPFVSPFEELPLPLVPTDEREQQPRAENRLGEEDDEGVGEEDIQSAIERLFGPLPTPSYSQEGVDSEDDDGSDYFFNPRDLFYAEDDDDDAAYEYDNYDYGDIPYSVHAKQPGSLTSTTKKKPKQQFPLIANRNLDANSIFSELANIVASVEEEGSTVSSVDFEQGYVEHPRFIFLEEGEDDELTYEGGGDEKRRAGLEQGGTEQDVVELGPAEERKDEEKEEKEGPPEHSTFYPVLSKKKKDRKEADKQEERDSSYYPVKDPKSLPTATSRTVGDCINSYFACIEAEEGGRDSLLLKRGKCEERFEACSDGRIWLPGANQQERVV